MLVYDNQEYTCIIRQLPDFVQRDQYGIPVIEPENIDTQLSHAKFPSNPCTYLL